MVVDPSGEATTLGSVTELRGAVVRTQLDTRVDSIRVRIAAATGTSGPLTAVPAGAIATLPRDAWVRVEEKSLDGGKTAALVVVTVLGALAIGLYALMRAYDLAS